MGLTLNFKLAIALFFMLVVIMLLFSTAQTSQASPGPCSMEENEAYCRRDMTNLTDFDTIANCSQLSDDELREICNWESAIVKTDVSYCKNVSQPYRDICYWDVSVTTFARNGRQDANFSICEKIENPEVRDGCQNKSYAMETRIEGKPYFEKQELVDYEICDLKDTFGVDDIETTVMMVMQGESKETVKFVDVTNASRCVGSRCGVPGWEFKSNVPFMDGGRNPFYELVDVSVFWPDGRKTVLEKDLNLATIAPEPIGGLTYRFVKYGTYQGFLPVGDYGFLFRKVNGSSCLVFERYEGEVVNIPENVAIEKSGSNLKISWNQNVLENAGFDIYHIVIYTRDRSSVLWSTEYENEVKGHNDLVIENPPLTLGQNYTLHFYAHALHGHAAEFLDFTWT